METIHLPATIDQLATVNRLLEKTLTGKLSGLLPKTQLIVEELLANICSYAYGGNGGAATFACGQVDYDGKPAIMIQLTDEGKPYDPFLESKTPDITATVEDRQIGGLGLYLVKELASHYSYFRMDNSNQTQIIIDVENS
ncbi:MAG: ATP-binding protein [Succinivibrio sp.]